MERGGYHLSNEHVIDITNSSDTSSSSSHERPSNGSENLRGDDPSTSSTNDESQGRNLSTVRRGNNRGNQRSQFNSGLWICVELILTVSQIVAAFVVLSLSGHEKPQAPLKTWILGYSSGCFLLLPVLYWRLKNRNQASGQESAVPLTGTASRTFQGIGLSNQRMKVFIEYLKMGLDCFFAVWFVVGNVWIFGVHSSSTEAPNMYRLCIIYLTISCIGYAMPFILCVTICCCLPCFISFLGLREDLSQSLGATQDSINSLPIHRFKMNKNVEETSSSASEGGVIAAGTKKERALSGEDAICCICLSKYMNNDELRELPCSHFFHKNCVDKWLRINASCPLCKSEVGETVLSSFSEATASLRNF